MLYNILLASIVIKRKGSSVFKSHVRILVCRAMKPWIIYLTSSHFLYLQTVCFTSTSFTRKLGALNDPQKYLAQHLILKCLENARDYGIIRVHTLGFTGGSVQVYLKVGVRNSSQKRRQSESVSDHHCFEDKIFMKQLEDVIKHSFRRF